MFIYFVKRRLFYSTARFKSENFEQVFNIQWNVDKGIQNTEYRKGVAERVSNLYNHKMIMRQPMSSADTYVLFLFLFYTLRRCVFDPMFKTVPINANCIAPSLFFCVRFDLGF